ncbi:MAG: LPS export ABC transporter periplasmic protein LptC [Rickettsiaceae bacterium]
MKNINDITKNNKIIKYSFLASGVIVLFLILFNPSNEEQKLIIDDLDLKTLNHIPKEFNLNMNNSILEGLNKDNLPYQIKANIVTKQNNSIYNLNTINARYNLSNGNLQILAETAVLNETTKFFTLYNNIKIISDNLILTSNKINFNLNSNIAYSEYPVEVSFQNSTIKAASFNTDDSSNIINFEGNVVSTFNLNDF